MSHATTTYRKPFFSASWRVGDAFSRQKKCWMDNIKEWTSCPCQKCSQVPPAGNTRRGSLLNLLSCLPDYLIGQGTELKLTASSPKCVNSLVIQRAMKILSACLCLCGLSVGLCLVLSCFECMSISVLTSAYESEMRGYFVYLLIVKYLSHWCLFKFSHSMLDWMALSWNLCCCC